jgi:hypothetical protein
MRLFASYFDDVGLDFTGGRVNLRVRVNERCAGVTGRDVVMGHSCAESGDGVRLRTAFRKGYGTGSRLTTDVIVNQRAVSRFFRSCAATVMRETPTG